MLRQIFLFIFLNLSFTSLLLAQWEEVNKGLFGGSLLTMTEDPTTNIFYAGTCSGVFISKDQGLTWEEKNQGFPWINYVWDILIIGDKIFATVSDQGIYLSEDKGDSWKLISEMKTSSFAGNSDYLFANVGNKVYRSSDSGHSWEEIYHHYSSAIEIVDSTIIFGTTEGVILSTDFGQSWSKGAGLNSWVRSLAVIGSTFYAGTLEGLYMSTDHGSNWTSVIMPFEGDINSIVGCNGNLFVLAYDYGIYSSSDNGVSWTAKNNGWDIRSINRLISIGKRIFAGISSQSAFYSDNNGDDWIPVNICLRPINAKQIVINDDKFYAAVNTGVSGLYMSMNSGNNWNRIFIFGVYAIAMNEKNIVISHSHGLFLSPDEGQNWNHLKGDMYFSSLIYSGDLVLGGGKNGVFLSANNGRDWVAVNNGLWNLNVLTLTANNGKIYAGTNGGGIFVSDNNGSIWTAINQGLSNLTINSIAAGDGKVFVGTNKGVFLSENEGITWSGVNEGLPENSKILSITFTGKNVFAGTKDSGIYLSTNYGNSWKAINEGLTHHEVNSISLNDSKVYIGTNGGGILKRPLQDMGLSVSSNIPKRDQLTILPNPVQDHLYLTQVATNSLISIYDLTGKKLMSIQAESKSQLIDVSKLMRGIYLIVVNDGHSSRTSKFTKR